MRKPYQSPDRMKNSSYYNAPVGDWTHDLPYTIASNLVKVYHSATEAVSNVRTRFVWHLCICLNTVCISRHWHTLKCWLEICYHTSSDDLTEGLSSSICCVMDWAVKYSGTSLIWSPTRLGKSDLDGKVTIITGLNVLFFALWNAIWDWASVTIMARWLYYH